jgi:hypothetical protein
MNNGKSISEIYFPDIIENPEASKGYKGHDELAIVGNNLKFIVLMEIFGR